MSICSTGFGDALNGAKPLAVTVKVACKLAGVGNTTMWKLIGDGKVATVSIGRRRLVLYPSLETLLTPEDRGSDAAA